MRLIKQARQQTENAHLETVASRSRHHQMKLYDLEVYRI